MIEDTFKKKKFLNIIILTALIAGTLDILAAIINTYLHNGRGPEIVFRFIASGIFGNEAFSGGALIIIAGIIFHYFIAFMWTLIFFLIYPKINFPIKFKIAVGLCYGIIIWLVMNLIVLPLSNTPKFNFNLGRAILGMAFLMFLVGLPISLMYHEYHNVVDENLRPL